MSRRFNRTQRITLFLASAGKCAICGAPLDETWEADHVQPYSKGGKTDVLNGQSLCKKCNRAKGDKTGMMKVVETVGLRPFQERFIDAAIRKAKAGEKVLVADVHPGSGKTLACLAAADKLMAAGYIQQIIVFVPRLNLTAQFELDWKEARSKLPWSPTMRGIFHRPNDPPLLLKDADGYISTYDSLSANPQLHIAQVAAKPALVIFDEAQQLGVDDENTHTTKSAQCAADLAKYAQMVFVMSGTPTRADGSQLQFATYDEPDKDGFQRLQSDVSSTYRDGVRDGYLRRFEAILHDGGANWRDLDAIDHAFTLSEMEQSVYHVITHKGYWENLVDRFIERVNDLKQKVDPRLCGLIAANNQKHAKEIEQYIRKHHPAISVLIAISDDGEAAHKALRTFKEGKHDVLITVSMAYVGYDYKPISVILVLTSFRTEGYLRQLLARGLRMSFDIPTDKQALHAFVPDDPKMREFVERLREESQWGVQERIRIEREREELERVSQGSLGYITDAWMSEIRAMGIDPTGDLNSDEYKRVDAIRARMGIPYPLTDLIAFARALQGDTTKSPEHETNKTMTEQLMDARRALYKLCISCDRQLKQEPGETSKELYSIFGTVEKVASIEEINIRMRKVAHWKEQGYYD